MLYSLQKGGVDPLGPENMLGILTGLSPARTSAGCRYMAVAKSPLTGGWGEANSGGFFGQTSSSPGGRGILHRDFTQAGILLLDDDKAELKDAAYLWGKTLTKPKTS